MRSQIMRCIAPLCLALALGAGCAKTKKNTEPMSSDKGQVGAAQTTAAAQQEQEAPDPARGTEQAVPDKPIVVLSTNMGDIKLELYKDKAPQTVANFVEYVRSGHYAGTVFHRVIDGFMIQGGGFNESLQEKPTRGPIQNEADNGLSNERGTIAMARTPNPNSASAQFFINVRDNSNLDHRDKSMAGWGYTVFGKVVAGLDVVDKIKQVQTTTKDRLQNVPVENVLIKEAKLVEG